MKTTTKQALLVAALVGAQAFASTQAQQVSLAKTAAVPGPAPANSAQRDTDHLNRTGTSKSNMFGNTTEEPKQIFRDCDSQGQQLDGRNLYTLTFPNEQQPLVNGFWSLTLYTEHHLLHPNPLNRFSFGSISKPFLKYNPDGSLTLYFGAKSPGKDLETNWLPAPDGAFSLYIRAFWAKNAILDGSWMLPQVEKVS